MQSNININQIRVEKVLINSDGLRSYDTNL